MHLHKTNKKVKPTSSSRRRFIEHRISILHKTNKRNVVYKCLFWNKDTNFLQLHFPRMHSFMILNRTTNHDCFFFCIYLGRSGKWFTQLTYARNVLSLPLVCVSLHQTKIFFSSFIPISVTIASFA